MVMKTQPHAFTIRPRVPADTPQLADLLRAVHALDGYPVEGIDDPAAFLALPEQACSWVAASTTADVLLGHVFLAAPPTTLAATTMGKAGAPTAQLGRLLTLPTARGAGIATTLVSTATRWAARNGWRVRLMALERNGEAMRLYERMGWLEVARGEFTTRDGRSYASRDYEWQGGAALSSMIE